jgi:spore germination cell wall hydrolase CwlJ-like protein
MQTMSDNASHFDWRDWLDGILRSVIGGGSSGVLSGLLSMGIAPDKFSLIPGHGLADTLWMMGGMFLGNGIIGMMIFLKTHDGPDKYQTKFECEPYPVPNYSKPAELQEQPLVQEPEPTKLTQNEKHLLRLAAWREARGDGIEAVSAVMHVLVNRAGTPGFAKRLYDCIMDENQISSMSIVSDPQFFLKPTADDAIWIATDALVEDINEADPTFGAFYYANLETMDENGWFSKNISGPHDTGINGHRLTKKVGKQTFFS